MKKQFLIHILFTPNNKARIFCWTVGKEIFHLVIALGFQKAERGG